MGLRPPPATPGVRTIPSKGDAAIEMLRDLYAKGTIGLRELEDRVEYALYESD